MTFPMPEEQTHVCPWHNNVPLMYLGSHSDDQLGLVHVYRCPTGGCLQMHDTEETVECWCEK